MQKLEEELTRPLPPNMEQLPPMEKLKFYWGAIVLVLTIIKVFTGKKADQRINEIIEWGDRYL